MYCNLSQSVSTSSSPPNIYIDTEIPIQEPGPATTLHSYSTPTECHAIPLGYDRPKDTINTEIMAGLNTIRRSLSDNRSCNSQPYHNPQLKSPKIVISPPLDDVGRTELPMNPVKTTHNKSMATAFCVAAFVSISVILLIVFFISVS